MGEISHFLNLLESGKLSEAKEMAYSSGSNKQVFLAALGDYFLENGDYSSAKSFYVSSISSSPNPAAEFGLGNALLSEGRIKESLPFFLSSAKSEIYAVKSLLKIGMAERLLGNIKGSLAAYLMAKSRGYDKHVADVNIAVLLSDLGEFEKAVPYYERAISKAPDDPKTRFNYSLHLLSSGDFKSGLEYYESRPWCFRGFGQEWDGRSGQNVLVISEQGYGDLIQFSRFIRDVKRVSERVALACDPCLSRFVSSSVCTDEIFGLDAESLKFASQKYPNYCRVMSIPFLMSLDIGDQSFFPINPDGDRVGFWKSKLEGSDSLKVGLCWQGGKRNDSEMIFNDRKRSINLSLLEPILKMDGLEFYSLQKNWDEPHPNIKDFMSDCGDFLDSATFINSLDLVISVDTAIAHVAGSLNKPVWMLSRLGGCWRWGNSGDRTFWYPSMKIFRQKNMDDWTSVVEEVRTNLVRLLES